MGRLEGGWQEGEENVTSVVVSSSQPYGDRARKSGIIARATFFSFLKKHQNKQTESMWAVTVSNSGDAQICVGGVSRILLCVK